MPQFKSQQHKERRYKLFEELRDCATKFLWTIISPRLLCLIICSNLKSMCVEQFAMTGFECHEILDQISKNEKGNIETRVWGNLRSLRWKDRRDVYILTNINAPSVEGNFTNESGQDIKFV